jgi:hypothetical protein
MIKCYRKPYYKVQTYCMICVYVSHNKVQSNSRFELYSKHSVSEGSIYLSMSDYVQHHQYFDNKFSWIIVTECTWHIISGRQ